jgi:hypothetical protein
MPRTLLKVALILVILVWPAIEAGSWFMARVQLDDDAANAAVTAADAVSGKPLNGQTAETAYRVASQELQASGGGEVDPRSLRLLKDGTVRFTAHRSAPSLLLGHLSWTRELMDVSVDAEGRSIDAGDLPLVPDRLVDNLPRSTP